MTASGSSIDKSFILVANRMSRLPHVLLLAVATLFAMPSSILAQDADRCIKMRTTPCKTSAVGSYLELEYENVCQGEVLVFLRTDFHTAASAGHAKLDPRPNTWRGPWRYVSEVENSLVRGQAQGSPKHNLPFTCYKPMNYVYCAEFFPAAEVNKIGFAEKGWDSSEEDMEKYLKYMAGLPCYEAIIQNPPKTKVSGEFHNLSAFSINLRGDWMAPKRNIWTSAGFLSNEYFPKDQPPLSALPKPSPR